MDIALQHPELDEQQCQASEIQPEWVSGKSQVGLTAGASGPEILVRAVIDRLNQLGIGSVTNLEGALEKVAFALPKGL